MGFENRWVRVEDDTRDGKGPVLHKDDIFQVCRGISFFIVTNGKISSLNGFENVCSNFEYLQMIKNNI